MQLKWSVFPKQIYSVTLGSVPVFDIALHHACSTRVPYYNEDKKREVGSVELKVEQLKEVNEIIESPVFWKAFYLLKEGIKKICLASSFIKA